MKGKKNKPAIISLKIFLFLLFVLIASSLLVYHLIPGTGTRETVYEEENSSFNKIKRISGKIDHLIYKSLFNEGVNEEDISFSKVVSKHKNDLDWDYIELAVQIEDQNSIDRLDTAISKNLARLSPDISFESVKVSNDQILINIKVFDFPTHRLELRYHPKEKIKTGKLPRIAFIIDDIGYDTGLAMSFLNLEIPVCLSILPDAPHSREIAAATVSKGGELLLHLPMEPKGYPEVDPGKDALMTSMDRETIQQIVNKQIIKFPGLKGVNHHMGSLFSEDSIRMKHVLDEIKRHNLFYIDSRTTTRTVAYKVARALGVPAAEKSLFIDNDLSEEALKYHMERLLGIARYKGKAIGIGHPHRETFFILKKYSEQLKEKYHVVPVSELAE